MWIGLSVLLFIPGLVDCRDTYTAAVVEYHPVKNFTLDPKSRILQNVNEYLKILADVKQDLDIIVFPEATITSGANLLKRDVLLKSSGVIPSRTDIPPCKSEEHAHFLKLLSCGARKRKTYLSVNLLEKAACKQPTCKHDDKWNVYNTNVVFDRQGNIIAKYRKYNLFGERELDTTDKPERVTFTTDFNVTFGVFICFDIMFGDPAQELVKSGVKHFVYPSMWFSELAQLTSLQTHGMWAYANDVVLLSSGANNPTVTGSGIFQGRLGPLDIYISGNPGTKVLVQEVQKNWSTKPHSDSSNVCFQKPNMTHFTFWKENYKNFTSQLLDVKVPKRKLCSNGTCCTFEINTTEKRSSSTNEYTYHVAMLSGYKHSKTAAVDLRVDSCIIMACLDADISTCGKRFVDVDGSLPLEFHNITVSLETTAKESAHYYPNSLTGDFIPLTVDQFTWKEELLKENKLKKTVTLIEKSDNLFTFGIFGRIYKEDVFY